MLPVNITIVWSIQKKNIVHFYHYWLIISMKIFKSLFSFLDYPYLKSLDYNPDATPTSPSNSNSNFHESPNGMTNSDSHRLQTLRQFWPYEIKMGHWELTTGFLGFHLRLRKETAIIGQELVKSAWIRGCCCSNFTWIH